MLSSKNLLQRTIPAPPPHGICMCGVCVCVHACEGVPCVCMFVCVLCAFRAEKIIDWPITCSQTVLNSLTMHWPLAMQKVKMLNLLTVYHAAFFFLSPFEPLAADKGIWSKDLDPPSDIAPFHESTLRFKSRDFSEHLSRMFSNDRSNDLSLECLLVDSVRAPSFSEVESDMESDFLSASPTMTEALWLWWGKSRPEPAPPSDKVISLRLLFSEPTGNFSGDQERRASTRSLTGDGDPSRKSTLSLEIKGRVKSGRKLHELNRLEGWPAFKPSRVITWAWVQSKGGKRFLFFYTLTRVQT